MKSHNNKHKSRELMLNLSLPEILLRYVVSFAVVIIGGLTHHIAIMVLGLPILITALIGWSPLYQILGINHSAKATKKEG